MRKFAVFIISLSVFSLLLCGVPTRAAAADGVSSREELQAWVDAHVETGGRVELLCPVTLDVSLTPSSYSNSLPPITVDTGAFGLIYNGGTLNDLPNVAVVGEGVDMPVVDIRCAPVFMGMDTTLQNLDVTATGRGGAGGTAVRMAQEISGGSGGFFGGGRGLIRSYGTGAVGLRLDAPGEASGLTIAVEGENSIAAFSTQGNTLTFCRLSATGVNARVAGGPQITLDTCSSSPAASGCAIVTRRIAGVLGEPLYLPMKQSSEAPTLDGTSWVDLLLRDRQGIFSTCGTAIDWDLSAMEGFDPTRVGTTTVPGSLPTALQKFGLEQDFPLARTLHVRDAALPCVTTTNRMEDDDSGRPYIVVRTAYREDLVPGYILWRSDDGGATWRDYTGAPEVRWADVHQPDNVIFELLRFYLDDTQADVLLQLELPGVGESNLVLLSSPDGFFFAGPGGDRDGGDRVISGQPPVGSSEKPFENEPGDHTGPPFSAPAASGTGKGEDAVPAEAGAAGLAAPPPGAQEAPEAENSTATGENAVSSPQKMTATAPCPAEGKETAPGGPDSAIGLQADVPAQENPSRLSTWVLPAAASAFAAAVTAVAAWRKRRVKR